MRPYSEEIDIKKKEMRVHYDNASWLVDLIEGTEFVTSRKLQIAEVLEGLPGLVPPRVVFELIS